MESDTVLAEIDIAKDLLAGAIELGSRDPIQKINLALTDDFGFMAKCFAQHETKHARAVEVLVESDLVGEALIILRAMIEGYQRLRWVSQNKVTRARRWKTYSKVENWDRSLIKKARGIGEGLTEAEKANILKVARVHLTEKARAAMKAQTKLPHPVFKPDWSGKSFAEIVKDLGKSVKEDVGYWESSKVSHWSPIKSQLELSHEEGNLVTRGYGENLEVIAIQGATLQLAHVLRIADEHFALGLKPELDRIFTGWVESVNRERTRQSALAGEQ